MNGSIGGSTIWKLGTAFGDCEFILLHNRATDAVHQCSDGSITGLAQIISAKNGSYTSRLQLEVMIIPNTGDHDSEIPKKDMIMCSYDNGIDETVIGSVIICMSSETPNAGNACIKLLIVSVSLCDN